MKTISVRINGLDTHYVYRDVIDVVEQAGAHVDTILIPKTGVPGDAGESAAEKVQILRDCGVTVVKLPSDFGTVVPKVLRR